MVSTAVAAVAALAGLCLGSLAAQLYKTLSFAPCPHVPWLLVTKLLVFYRAELEVVLFQVSALRQSHPPRWLKAAALA